MMHHMKAQEMNVQELEQITGGVDIYPGTVGGPALYVGSSPEITPTIAQPVITQVIPVTNSTYVIQIGDTLSGIARKFHTTVNVLLAMNPKITDPNKIKAGDTIYVG